MSLHTARLSKILKIAYAPEKMVRKDIFDDVSGTIRKENNPDTIERGGGDFHGVLWAAFKDQIFEEAPESFEEAVETLILSNPRRKRLFPALAAGLKSWGLEKRRWINEDIKRIKSPTGTICVEGQDVAFKVNNILALEIVGKSNRYIYPYFSEEPALSNEAARVALWQIHMALPDIDINEFRLLDVMRGRSFSIAEVPFAGNEQVLFEQHATRIMNQWKSRYTEKKET